MALAFIFADAAHGRENVSLVDLIKETQIQSQDPTRVALVWWLPEEFWATSIAQNPGVSEAMVKEFVETVRPYTMIVVVDGSIGAFGGVTFRSEGAVRGATTLVDSKGRTYKALEQDRIDADVKNLMQMMKPVLANMAGPMGRNMHFLVFPAKDEKGEMIADATREGSFKVLVGKTDYAFRLPLGSLLPPKYDPRTGEKFPGNYNYNPFTGTKLGTRSPKQPGDAGGDE